MVIQPPLQAFGTPLGLQPPSHSVLIAHAYVVYTQRPMMTSLSVVLQFLVLAVVSHVPLKAMVPSTRRLSLARQTPRHSRSMATVMNAKYDGSNENDAPSSRRVFLGMSSVLWSAQAAHAIDVRYTSHELDITT